MMTLLYRFAFLILLFAFGSCATVFSGRKQYIFVETYPEDALITRNGEYLGKTPALISIKRNSRDPIELSKDGFAPQTIRIKRSLNPLVFFNFGNPLGYKIDLMTGASFRFDKDYYIRSLCSQSEQVVTSEVTSFVEDTNLIAWSQERRLSESDFKGGMSQHGSIDFAAGSNATIACTYQLGDTATNIRILSVFSGMNSYLKPGKSKTKILNHEQMHFDIVEIYARKIRQQVAGRIFDKKSFSKEFNSICFFLIQEMEAYQAFFDEEITNASSLKEMESKWSLKIKNELLELSDYKETVMHVSFSRLSGSN